jgi:hypothetical protein
MKKWWVEEFFFWLEPVGDRRWSRRDILWVPVYTPGLAKWARGPALIFAVLFAFGWTSIALVGLFVPSTYGHWDIIYAIVWILVTWGLLEIRPEAAIGGFVLSVFGFIGEIEGSLHIARTFFSIARHFFLSIVMVWTFGQAIRGTFAYQRLAKRETDDTSEDK